MKVGFISHASILNGAPITLVELVRELAGQPDPLAYALGVPAPGPLLERYDLPGVEIFTYARTGLGKEIAVGRPRIRRRLKRMMAARGIGLAAANSLESFRAVEAAADLGIPVIWLIHELAAGYEKRREWAEIRSAARRADRLIFNSRIGLSQAGFLGEGLEAKSRVIYPGISLDRPGGKENSSGRESLSGRPVLGFIGDVCPQKGLRDLVEFFAIVALSHPRASLVIAGRIPARFESFKKELDGRLRGLNLGARVQFAGEFFDLRRRLKDFDLLIHPSPSESFGRVVAEALAQGVPVVAARSGGVEEIIRDGETGYLAPPGDPGALAAVVLRMLADPEKTGEMTRRGRQEVADRFSLARSAEAIKEEIKSFLVR
jgi:glycosyltransferase involved in cell wall biosynthesis